jgi:hypothetical protein
MKKHVLYSLLIIVIFLIGACTFNNVYINREEDNKEGKVFLNKFYSNVINENYKSVDGMVGDSLKQLAGANGISKLVKFINMKVGKCKSYTIDDHYIRCQTGSNNETSYNYKLKVTYDKGIIDEIIGFKKQNGSDIKINSYHANSDLLMH